MPGSIRQSLNTEVNGLQKFDGLIGLGLLHHLPPLSLEKEVSTLGREDIRGKEANRGDPAEQFIAATGCLIGNKPGGDGRRVKNDRRHSRPSSTAAFQSNSTRVL